MLERSSGNSAVVLWTILQRLSGALRYSIDLANYRRTNLLPFPPVVTDEQKWLPASRLGLTGIDLREADQLERISQGKSEKYPRTFAKVRGNSDINTERVGQTSLTSGWYNTPDAEIYAAMILDRQPRRIVEVGAGFSTRSACDSIRIGPANSNYRR